MDWLRQAKLLPFGGKRKIVCCGEQPSMIINHTAKGFSAYCFRDATHGGFEPHGLLSIGELKARHAASTDLVSGPLSLPKDFTTTIPTEHRLWLLRASVNGTLSTHYGFGYSASSNRVILPVYRGDEMVAFVARATDNQKPKYIARHKDGVTDAIFASDPTVMLPSADISGYDLILTEDILSAVRVGRLVRSGALLGTTVAGKEGAVFRLCGDRQSPRIGLWFDGDKAGRTARDRIGRRLAIQGAEIIKINTALDPKRYSNREIKEILLDRLNPPTLDEVPEGLQSGMGSIA